MKGNFCKRAQSLFIKTGHWLLVSSAVKLNEREVEHNESRSELITERLQV